MRPGARQSIVWNFFKKSPDNQFAICNLCKKHLKFFKNTTNLREHLHRKHPIQFLNKPPTDNSEREDTLENNTEKNNCDKPNTSSSSSVSHDGPQEASHPGPSNVSSSSAEVHQIPVPKRPRQLKLYGAKKTNELTETETKLIDKCLVQMIVGDYQPLSLVENAGFLAYSKALQPLYSPPSRKQLTTRILPDLYIQSATELKQIMDSVENVSITTDIWTSDSNKGYLTVTVHFIFDGKMWSRVLATEEICGAHTGENISKHLSSISNKWNILNKITGVVTDNGANIKNAIHEHLKKHHHPCVAHTLNLSVMEALSSSSNNNFSMLVKKCKAIVTHFKHSVQATEKLKSIQEQMGLPTLKVKQDVTTRWNSTLIMMERLLQIKDPLSVTITNLPRAPEYLDAEEWSIIADCVSILKPVEKITTELSAEKYPTMSFVIPLVIGLQYALNNKAPQTNAGSILKDDLQTIINRRLGCLESNKIVAMATFLDPRFKKTGFGLEDNAKRAEHWVIEELTKLLNEEEGEFNPKNVTNNDIQLASTSTSGHEENESIWTHFDSKVAQVKSHVTPTTASLLVVKQYLQMPHVDRKQNPLHFWESHKNFFPKLYLLARKYLCVPATSVPSERVFSKAGQLCNDRRNRLSSQNLDHIIFLNACL